MIKNSSAWKDPKGAQSFSARILGIRPPSVTAETEFQLIIPFSIFVSLPLFKFHFSIVCSPKLLLLRVSARTQFHRNPAQCETSSSVGQKFMISGKKPTQRLGLTTTWTPTHPMLTVCYGLGMPRTKGPASPRRQGVPGAAFGPWAVGWLRPGTVTTLSAQFWLLPLFTGVSREFFPRPQNTSDFSQGGGAKC